MASADSAVTASPSSHIGIANASVGTQRDGQGGRDATSFWESRGATAEPLLPLRFSHLAVVDGEAYQVPPSPPANLRRISSARDPLLIERSSDQHPGEPSAPTTRTRILRDILSRASHALLLLYLILFLSR